MDYNYHTHTFRCHHAKGTPEEYIQRAISCGIQYMGFSDHIPFVFPDGYESAYRVFVSDVSEYFSELTALREKYQNEIEIKIGFEMEYYPKYASEMIQNAIEYGAEYLIMGLHFLNNEHPDGIHPIIETQNEAYLEEYAQTMIEAIRCGVFTYIAHPDMIHFTGDNQAYEREIRKIFKASKECNVPLEINFLGIRDNRIYPNEAFWKIAGEEQSPVTFGFDAHDAHNAYDGDSLVKAKELVKKYQLNYIGKPTIVNIQTLN